MLHFGKSISDITERTYNSNGRHEAEKMTYTSRYGIDYLLKARDKNDELKYIWRVIKY